MTVLDLERLASEVTDGASIALAPDYSGCSMAMARALIRDRRRNLHLIGVPSLGLQADWLIGAGCVTSIETAALTLGEAGLPPRAAAAVKSGTIAIRDATCPAIHAGLQAAEKGIPFMPLRGILGSDLLAHRNDWKVIANPFKPADVAGDDPIVLVPAIRPDVAIFHAAAADREGNVFIGVRRELMLMAHAARRTLVTVERIEEDRNFLRDDATASGTIPSLYVSAIAIATRGAAPVGLAGAYPADAEAVAAYARAAKTQDGFNAWAAENLFGAVTA